MGASTWRPHSAPGIPSNNVGCWSSAAAAAAAHGPNGCWKLAWRAGRNGCAWATWPSPAPSTSSVWTGGASKTVAPACRPGCCIQNCGNTRRSSPGKPLPITSTKPAICAKPCSNAAMNSAFSSKSSTQRRHRPTALPQSLSPWWQQKCHRGAHLAAGDAGVTAGCTTRAKPSAPQPGRRRGLTPTAKAAPRMPAARNTPAGENYPGEPALEPWCTPSSRSWISRRISPAPRCASWCAIRWPALVWSPN